MQHVVAEGDGLGPEAAAHLVGAPPELLLAVAYPGKITVLAGFQKPVLLFTTGIVAQKMTFVFLDLKT
jgi:hypothetical protein